jgi:hypothetical protein
MINNYFNALGLPVHASAAGRHYPSRLPQKKRDMSYHSRYVTAQNPVAVIVSVYGSAIHTMRP